MACIFCNGPLESTGVVLWRDEICAAVLHDDHSVVGHTMVVAARHVENMSDLNPDEARHFGFVARIVEKALLEATGAERSVLMKLGVQTPHLHLHIYPVSANWSRAEVMAAIDGTARAPVESVRNEEALVKALRERIASAAADLT